MALPQWLRWLTPWSPAKGAVGVKISVPLNLVTEPKPMNLSAILVALQAINTLLPEAVKLIQTIETAFPNATVDAKLDAVVKALESFQQLEAELAQPVSIVTNIIGMFSGKSAAPAAVAQAPVGFGH